MTNDLIDFERYVKETADIQVAAKPWTGGNRLPV